MKDIQGSPWPFKPPAGLKKIKDLIYFDGPLLSHFEGPNGDDYLYYWVDCDDQSNRWMVARVDEASILRLENRVVPLDFVIPHLCRDEFVLFVDYDADHQVKQTQALHRSQIPIDYLPAVGAYLPVSSLQRSRRSSSILLEGLWKIADLSDFPRIYSKAYALLYGLNVLHLGRLANYPCRGGFSSMHFFDWVAKKIPAEDRPCVEAMQYSSPGFIRFSLHGPTADDVSTCIFRYLNENKMVAESYGRLTAYIKEHRLIDITDPDDAQWASHSGILTQGATDVLGNFGVADASAFVAACARPFEAAQIARCFYNHVRTLAGFEKNGLARFPDAPGNVRGFV